MKKCIINIFTGTDPGHKVQGDNTGERKVTITMSVEEKKSKEVSRDLSPVLSPPELQ